MAIRRVICGALNIHRNSAIRWIILPRAISTTKAGRSTKLIIDCKYRIMTALSLGVLIAYRETTANAISRSINRPARKVKRFDILVCYADETVLHTCVA